MELLAAEFRVTKLHVGEKKEADGYKAGGKLPPLEPGGDFDAGSGKESCQEAAERPRRSDHANESADQQVEAAEVAGSDGDGDG